MPAKVNIDNFTIGPRSRTLLWALKRQHPALYLVNRLEWYYYPKKLKVPRFPLHVDFETSAACNMNCPMCFRRRSDYKPEAFGVMDFNVFQKGVDECARHGLYSIRLSWRGECTTNPRLVEMIAYARKAGIKEISFISNGYTLEGKLAEDIVKAGVDYITVSVDGLYEEYNSIRAPATFEGTVERLKNLRRLRDTIGKGYPRIRINSVWNETRGEEWFYQMYAFFSPIVDFMTFTPEYAQDGKPKQLRPQFTCQYPFQRISIMWNGTIPLCITDKRADYILGHLERDTLYGVWHGKRMTEARTLHREHRAAEIPSCVICDRAVTRQIGNKKVNE